MWYKFILPIALLGLSSCMQSQAYYESLTTGHFKKEKSSQVSGQKAIIEAQDLWLREDGFCKLQETRLGTTVSGTGFWKETAFPNVLKINLTSDTDVSCTLFYVRLNVDTKNYIILKEGDLPTGKSS